MSDNAFMAIFGGNATQTETEIVIPKNGLPMTAAANNGGEQIYAAMTKNAKSYLSTKRFDDDATQNITIEDGMSGEITRKEGEDNISYRKFQVVTSFHERDEARNSGINPDKY